jgi:hypothetical protein
MKGPRFKSAVRFVLDYVGEGLMWIGLGMGLGVAPPFEMTTRRRGRDDSRETQS